jgi:hypothetical protein
VRAQALATGEPNGRRRARHNAIRLLEIPHIDLSRRNEALDFDGAGVLRVRDEVSLFLLILFGIFFAALFLIVALVALASASRGSRRR